MGIPADYDGYAAVVAEERVTMAEIAGGNPKNYIKLMLDNGVKVLHKSATIRHALKAQAAGVDLIEVVGYEASIAGGQPSLKSEFVGLSTLLNMDEDFGFEDCLDDPWLRETPTMALHDAMEMKLKM